MLPNGKPLTNRKRACERISVQTQFATLDNTLSSAQKFESISLAEGNKTPRGYVSLCQRLEIAMVRPWRDRA
jgi:hypothetical protein